MREMPSEPKPVCQHFLKQNSFQLIPELVLSDARNTKILRERIPWLRTSHGEVAMVHVLAYAYHYSRWVGEGGGEEMIKSPIIIEGARRRSGKIEQFKYIMHYSLWAQTMQWLKLFFNTGETKLA